MLSLLSSISDGGASDIKCERQKIDFYLRLVNGDIY